ncbi:MAG: hypothetical protein ACE14L_04845 [Terriglobales bacterium]
MATQTQPATPTPATAGPPLGEVLALRDRYTRRGDYKLLGRVLCASTEHGFIDYGKAGPVLAQLTDGEPGALVLLGAWDGGFPARMKLLTELCPACQTKCTDCDGKGKRLCTRCGGRGDLVMSHKDCPGCFAKTGKTRRGCKSCGGRGQVPDQLHLCPACKGKKRERCARCEGTGRMSTGYKDGANPRVGEAPLCPECEGHGRKREAVPQPWAPIAAGTLEGYTALGPFLRLLLTHLPGDEPAFTDVEFTPDADGNYPVMLIKDPAAHSQPMYLFGGCAAIRPR